MGLILHNDVHLPILITNYSQEGLAVYRERKKDVRVIRVLTRTLKTGFIESIPGKSWSQN